MTEPASIRYKNPGAMWGGNAITKKWGEQGNVALNDGTGQGNHIAIFPTYVQGICAQIDLWRTSSHYKNKPFAVGIATWSGGNSVESYVKLVTKRVPGMTRDTVMNDAFWRSSMAIPFLKAQAFHEAGKEYPALETDWIEAQRRVCGGVAGQAPAVPTKPAPKPQPPKPATIPTAHATGIAATLIAAAVAIGKWGAAHPIEVSIGFAAAVGVVVLIIRHARKKG